MRVYKTNNGKELSMNEAAREGFQKLVLQANILFMESVKAYHDGNIDMLAALTASIYSRMDFLYCIFDEKDKKFLNTSDALLYSLMLLDNPEAKKVINHVDGLKSKSKSICPTT